MRGRILAGCVAAAIFAMAGAGCVDQMEKKEAGGETMAHENMWTSVTHAVAVIEPTKSSNSNISGTIKFDQMGDHVHVTGEVRGLTPNSEHGFHIHEFGDGSSDNGAAAGGHFNPEGHPHGGPESPEHHAGDLGNITAGADGVAKVDAMVHGISIAGMKNPIIGRSVVVHANKDDFTTQGTAPNTTPGMSGPRIGVGVIGIAKNP